MIVWEKIDPWAAEPKFRAWCRVCNLAIVCTVTREFIQRPDRVPEPLAPSCPSWAIMLDDLSGDAERRAMAREADRREAYVRDRTVHKLRVAGCTHKVAPEEPVKKAAPEGERPGAGA